MFQERYPHLFQPLKVGPLTFKNRILASPISLFDLDYSRNFYVPTEKDIGFYRLRAMGGAALVTVGDTVVHPSGIAPNSRKLLICEETAIPHLVNVTQEIHKFGAYATIELNHGGIRTARANFPGQGPDDTTLPEGYHVHGMTREEIEEVAEYFGISARICQLGGFDMVTIHAGHGWLLGGFLSPLSNHRTDEFGGSLENRARFTMMAIDAIRRHCGPNFPIEVRFSANERTPGGIELDEGIAFAKMLDGVVDLLHVSTGTLLVGETEVITHPSLFLEHGCNVFLAEAVKPHIKKTPVVTVGSLSEPEMLEEIIASGKADAVAMGRALIADPALPRKARSGREDEIRPCLRCLNCLGDGMVTGSVRCSVNPVIGHERDIFNAQLPYDRRKVLVVGGGPAGMQAAITCAERGHRVILCEKSGQLGGLIRYATHADIKGDLAAFMEYLIRMVGRSGVEVRLNTEVTAELVERLAPDAMLVAVGSEDLIPRIPGVEKAMPIMDLYESDLTAGEKVVLIGGGLAGCEAGIELARKGHKVTVVEMRDTWAPDANSMHRTAMNTQFEDNNVTVLTSTRCTAIEDGAVVCEGPDGTIRLEADTIVLAAGRKPRTAAADALFVPGVDIVRIGDCSRAAQVREAVRTAYDAARAIGLKM